MKYWLGPVPQVCDVCSEAIKDRFFDAATTFGPWANMCLSCFTLGPGYGKLGTGLGQEYVKQSDGRWLKIGG